MSSTNTAPIKYAQRSDSLYLTIALPDVKDETIVLTDKELKFNGTSGDKSYEVNIEFFKEVDSEGSTYKVLPRSIQMHILKKDKEEEEFWPRLLKDKAHNYWSDPPAKIYNSNKSLFHLYCYENFCSNFENRSLHLTI